jgi:prepilin-type N-terminal cleavage/methylation domain-containing protein
MNSKQRTNKAFTLIELVVSIGILAIILSFASTIFKVSIDSHRVALANAEIMQKLRTITDQLDADFKSLRKEGQIFVAWVAVPMLGSDPKDPNSYERFDRIMFFAQGDFQSYNSNPKVIRGNLARISYMLAKRGNDRPEQQPREKRILARTQHILTADAALDDDASDPNTFSTDVDWYKWHNLLEYDKQTLEEWKNIPWQQKRDMLSVIIDIVITDAVLGPSKVDESVWGVHVDPADPCSIHVLLCEGVSEFKIQGWYEAQHRWLPEIDPDGDGFLTDSDFFLDASGKAIEPTQVPGVLYPYPPYGGVSISNVSYPHNRVNQENFNAIPGLGRALKFTFTLYDSKGIIKEGQTFTHIVYLED